MQYSAVLYVHDARHCRQSRYPFLNILPFFPSCVFNYLGVNRIPVQCPVGAIHPHVYSLHCSRMRDILCRGLDLLTLRPPTYGNLRGRKEWMEITTQIIGAHTCSTVVFMHAPAILCRTFLNVGALCYFFFVVRSPIYPHLRILLSSVEVSYYQSRWYQKMGRQPTWIQALLLTTLVFPAMMMQPCLVCLLSPVKVRG